MRCCTRSTHRGEKGIIGILGRRGDHVAQFYIKVAGIS